VDKYAGDNWIVDEYFVDHNDDYLVSHSEIQIQRLSASIFRCVVLHGRGPSSL